MKRNFFQRQYVGLFVYCLVLMYAVVFSYSFTDPNLVLSTNAFYWQFQLLLWHTWFDHPLSQAWMYFGVVTLLWCAFAWLVYTIRQQHSQYQHGKQALLVVACGIGISFFAYNALSHDVFNYLFNARMVVFYHADPHQRVALDFVGDPWLRFMHNTHTSAPYGYGWTGISLLPYVLGGEKFLPTWLLFRTMAVGALLGIGVTVWRWLQLVGLGHRRWLVLAIGISPFVLTEVVMNMHNDVWMLWGAVASLYLLDRWRRLGGWWQVLVAAMLLVFSISIKFATLMLVPLAFWIVAAGILGKSTTLSRYQHFFQLNTQTIALLASIALFVPLLTARSQYFHPWYLMWPLVWLPLVTRKGWWSLIVGLAVSSTYRYLPWIAAGGYEGTVLQQQQLVTWVFGLLCALLTWLVLCRAKQSV